YPSLMIAYNLCYSTVIDDDAHSDYTDENFEIVEWEDHVGCEHDPNIKEREKLKSIFEDLAKVEKRKCIGVQPITKYFKPTSTTRKPVDDVEDYSECNGFTDDNYNGSPIPSTKLSSVDLQRAAIRLKVLKSRMSGGSRLCAKQRVRILKTRRGLLPDLVEYFLDARRKVRAEMKNVSDPLARDILDKSQLAYKITANSIYGATGASNGKLPCKNVAKAITALGRKVIKESIQMASDKGIPVIYGDTD
ncbi:DNA polymerase, partial [Trichoplusia ni ascovirus 2a]